MRVSAEGGAPQVLTTPDAAAGERRHAWPIFLPGGEVVLYTVLLAEGMRDRRRRPRDREAPGHGDGRGAPALRGLRPPAVLGRPRDQPPRRPLRPRDATLGGSPVTVLPSLPSFSDGRLAYDVSSDGTLIFGTAQLAMDAFRVVWVDRDGRESSAARRPRELDPAAPLARRPTGSSCGARPARTAVSGSSTSSAARCRA